MITVSAAGAFLGAPGAGLRTVPDDAGWVPARLLWLPVFAAALAVYWAVFRTDERRRPSGRSRAGRRDGDGHPAPCAPAAPSAPPPAPAVRGGARHG